MKHEIFESFRLLLSLSIVWLTRKAVTVDIYICTAMRIRELTCLPRRL
jgi:hypothetical protein